MMLILKKMVSSDSSLCCISNEGLGHKEYNNMLAKTMAFSSFNSVKGLDKGLKVKFIRKMELHVKVKVIEIGTA